MTDLVQLVSIVVSAALLVTIVELVRRGRLTEEYSFIWIVCAVALFALSLWRNLLDLAASGPRRPLPARGVAAGLDVIRGDRLAVSFGGGVAPPERDRKAGRGSGASRRAGTRASRGADDTAIGCGGTSTDPSAQRSFRLKAAAAGTKRSVAAVSPREMMPRPAEHGRCAANQRRLRRNQHVGGVQSQHQCGPERPRVRIAAL